MSRKKAIKKIDYSATKNYLIVCGMIVIIAILLIGFSELYPRLKSSNLSKSYLISHKVISKTLTLDDAASTLANENNYFIYISYTGSEDIYNLEKKLKPIINDYHLNDSFYYLDITNIKNDYDYISKVNKALNYDDNALTKLPTIIYVKNHEVIRSNIITREDNQLISAADFQKLLDINGFKK